MERTDRPRILHAVPDDGADYRTHDDATFDDLIGAASDERDDGAAIYHLTDDLSTVLGALHERAAAYQRAAAYVRAGCAHHGARAASLQQYPGHAAIHERVSAILDDIASGLDAAASDLQSIVDGIGPFDRDDPPEDGDG